MKVNTMINGVEVPVEVDDELIGINKGTIVDNTKYETIVGIKDRLLEFAMVQMGLETADADYLHESKEWHDYIDDYLYCGSDDMLIRDLVLGSFLTYLRQKAEEILQSRNCYYKVSITIPVEVSCWVKADSEENARHIAVDHDWDLSEIYEYDYEIDYPSFYDSELVDGPVYDTDEPYLEE